MNISYKWLKDYINLDLSPDEVASTLTYLGLETANVTEFESVKGGLKGLVVGEVITCQKHPNSDHLSLTTVDTGETEYLPIVCGAPNVKKGQKVIVAKVGTVLYKGEEQFVIEKSKIRGETSMGMICAEDEIGIGTDHSGIMVLSDNAVPGTLASDYFNIQSDYIFEVDLTPNRIDGASHIGIARDLSAYLKKSGNIGYICPSVDEFSVDNHSLSIPVTVENPEACPRYSGVTISGVKVKESPEWLKNRLRSIGLNPINNIVDITNFVLYETGQPLHAFDADEITGGKVIVKTLPKGTKFQTLDGIERELDDKDLMICNEKEGMCIGGVFGGIKSGIKEITTNIFLESAYFNPVYIRKTARRHGLNTDASFHFERGTDPVGTVYALKRAALLIKELAGGEISSEIFDIVPDPSILLPFHVTVSYANINRLIGKVIPEETIKDILGNLEIIIEKESPGELQLLVPRYRVDVRSEADVIEELLRIYGYDNVESSISVKSTLQHSKIPDKVRLQNIVSEFLTSRGFNEIISNSLTKKAYYENCETFKAENTVSLFNPLSSDLNGMRQTLIFGGLEAISRNINFRNEDLCLYEFGNVYSFDNSNIYNNPVRNFNEEEHLGLWITGKKENPNWAIKEESTSFFNLKAYIENILSRIGIEADNCQIDTIANDIFSEGLEYRYNKMLIADFGYVNSGLLRAQDITKQVFYGDLHWKSILNVIGNIKISYSPLPKYPEVRRDLALLLDKEIKYSTIRELALKTEKQILRSINLFDVYFGENLPEGKKSYAISFILRDDEKTLNDKRIEVAMSRLISVFKREAGAQIR